MTILEDNPSRRLGPTAGNRVLKTGSTKGVKQKLQSSLLRSGRKLTRDILKSY